MRISDWSSDVCSSDLWRRKLAPRTDLEIKSCIGSRTRPVGLAEGSSPPRLRPPLWRSPLCCRAAVHIRRPYRVRIRERTRNGAEGLLRSSTGRTQLRFQGHLERPGRKRSWADGYAADGCSGSFPFD